MCPNLIHKLLAAWATFGRGVETVELAQDHVQGRDLVSVIVNLEVLLPESRRTDQVLRAYCFCSLDALECGFKYRRQQGLTCAFLPAVTKTRRYFSG